MRERGGELILYSQSNIPWQSLYHFHWSTLPYLSHRANSAQLVQHFGHRFKTHIGLRMLQC